MDTGQPVEPFQKYFATLSPRLILNFMKVMLEVGTNWEVCYEVKNVYYLFVVQLVFSQKMLTVTRIKCQGEFVILVTVILPKYNHEVLSLHMSPVAGIPLLQPINI